MYLIAHIMDSPRWPARCDDEYREKKKLWNWAWRAAVSADE